MTGEELKEHIERHHKGNNSAFARSIGVSQHQVQRWLKRNCMVIDGKVYCQVSKSKRKGNE